MIENKNEKVIEGEVLNEEKEVKKENFLKRAFGYVKTHKKEVLIKTGKMVLGAGALVGSYALGKKNGQSDEEEYQSYYKEIEEKPLVSEAQPEEQKEDQIEDENLKKEFAA